MNANSHQPAPTSIRVRLASLYFAMQSVLGLLWWIGIESSPEFSKYFFSLDTAYTDLRTFALAEEFETHSGK